MGRGRDFKLEPPIDDIKEYAEQMRAWWSSLQPKWRIESAKESWPLGRVAPASENWDGVVRGGANGLMVFIVALAWWFRALEDETSARELASMIEDVRWVLDKINSAMEDGIVIELLTSRAGGVKRGREGDEEKGRNEKKR